MLDPDNYFQTLTQYFPPVNRLKARILFRNAIHDYYEMQSKYVIEPRTGREVQEVFIGELIKTQKNQRRKVTRFFRVETEVGRPKRPEIKLLIARIFILWKNYANIPATFSRKGTIQTEFEIVLHDLFPRLGAPDVRRYVEAHWKARK